MKTYIMRRGKRSSIGGADKEIPPVAVGEAESTGMPRGRHHRRNGSGGGSMTHIHCIRCHRPVTWGDWRWHQDDYYYLRGQRQCSRWEYVR